MPMDTTPEPPHSRPRDGQDRTVRPAPVTSIQRFESADVAEAPPMSENTVTDNAAEAGPAPDVARGSAVAPGVWPPRRADPARGTARVSPADADLQTSEGVPAVPINEIEAPAAAEPEAAAEPDAAAEPGTVAEPDAGAAEPGIAAEPEAAREAAAVEVPAGTGTPAEPATTAEAHAVVETPVAAGEVGAKVVVVPGRREPAAGVPVAARAAQPAHERRAKPRGGPYDLGHSPAVLMVSSLGVLLVALAYTGGRESVDGAPVAYWIGQVVVFTPVVLRLLSRRMAGVAEAFLLVIGLAVNQYLLKWMYSPDQFRFPDELQHWLATTVIMETGELFRPNPALPPAVHFPGLAEMGAAVASMTGLPVTYAGILVAGVAHLVFVGVLFACVLRTSNSPAVAGVACATYATALHYLFFSSMFLYQTAALPFFMLAIWANRRWREEGGKLFVVVAAGAIAMTTVSHHVTAFALIATLFLLGVTELITDRPGLPRRLRRTAPEGRGRRRWSALAMPAASLGIVAAWILLVARDVIGYLEEPVNQVISTVSALAGGTATASTASAPVSVVQLVLQGAGLLGLLVLFAAVGRDMVSRHDRDAWRWAALIGGAVFFLGNGVRFLGSNGPEITGRLSTFTYIPISIIAAIALVRAVQILPSRDAAGRRHWVAPALATPPPTGHHLVVRVLAGSALVTLLMIGARAGGWPPLGSLLPGPYLAGGFERSVDAYGVDAANWERTTLGPGHRVGGDVTSVSLSSTYGRQDPVREVAPLFYATRWSLAADNLVERLDLDYLVVDRRLSTQLPLSDAYFEDDPQAGRLTRPLSVTQLAKFDALADTDRLYDNGTVRIYRMGNDQ
jgi:hypothetical protein